MQRLGIGLIGSGFMGRSHALAFRTVSGVFDLPAQPALELLADIDEEQAARAAQRLGFTRSTSDWRALVSDSPVDVVAITTPNILHKPMALAAIAAGKAVYCEKPLATTLADAREMVEAAEQAGVVTLVGFNYLRNPMIGLAKQLIDSGELGEITGFHGTFAEDFMADPLAPWNWRCDPAGGGGALADLGSHLISMARHLLGGIDSVCAHLHTVHRQRPAAAGSQAMRPIEIDDQAHALLRFANGASGSFSTSWIASGHKNHLAFAVVGTKGSLEFDQERFNELRLFQAGTARGRDGFKTLLAEPEHPGYGAFCPAAGHQLGFNDLKTLEVKALIEAVCGKAAAYPDFREAWEVERITEAFHRSSRERRWVDVAEI